MTVRCVSDRVVDVLSKLAITISFAYSSHIFTALFFRSPIFLFSTELKCIFYTLYVLAKIY